MKTISILIKKYRIEKNITQEEMASKIGISRQTLSYIENNKNINLNNVTIGKIMKVLKLSKKERNDIYNELL